MEDEEQYLTMSEVKALLEKEERDRGVLTQEQKFALTHSQAFARLEAEKSQALAKELATVDLVTPPFASKLADLLPKTPDEVRSVFAKERFSLEKADVDRVVEIVAKYL